jgi:pimeloyl-ACP methyl ester carboxylesterase
MTSLIVVVVVLGGGAVVTLIGTHLIERAHLPRGRFIDVGGLRQHVVELGPNSATHGTPPPIVLLHGAGANLEDMRLALADRLGAGGRRLILVDRPGFGFSARKGREGRSPAYQAAMLGEVLDRLGVDRAIIVGHSWGGAMALTFALDFPQRVAGLVLIAAPTHPGVWTLSMINSLLATPIGWLFARTLALPFGAILVGPGCRSAFLPQPLPPHYVKRSATMLVLRPPTLLANWADIGVIDAFLAQQAGRYGELSAPVVALNGDSDPLVRPEHHALKLAAATPMVKAEVLPGFGHMLHHAAADRVAAAVQQVAVRLGEGERQTAIRKAAP